MKRALVLASEIRGLKGANHDAARMAAVLTERGFVVDHRWDATADRAGMIAGWRALIDAAQPGDAVVVFYAGHGAQFLNTDPDAGAPGIPREGQVILPTDYDQNTELDFRGITTWELSLLLAELTARTPNVVLLLDCCYAANMARDATDAIPRTLAHPVRLGIKRHLDELRDRGARFDLIDPLGNPHAVRGFGAGAHQSSWEFPVDDVYRGAFTDALVWALAEVGPVPVTWSTLAVAIRDRVSRRFASQWPEFAGPVGRALFSTHEPQRVRAFALSRDAGGTAVRAGRLAGTVIGDTFRVMPMGATTGSAADMLALATAIDVGALASTVTLAPELPAVPDGALAFPLTEQLPREPVAVRGVGPEADALRDRIASTARLRLVTDATEAPMATIEVVAGAATIADRVGPLLPPVTLTGDDAQRNLDDVAAFARDLAVARSLRLLTGVHGVDAEACVVSWGVIDSGTAAPRPSSGAVLGLRDRIYIRIDNRAKNTNVWVHVFNVGSRGKITRLSTATHGIRLPADDSFTLGDVPGQGLVGFKLSWPAGLPRDLPRQDELYVIATTAPIDLTVLETEQALARSAIARGAAPLTAPLAALGVQMFDGGSRSVEAGDVDGVAVCRVDFMLDPVDLALASPSFQVDDNPNGTRGALARGAWRADAALIAKEPVRHRQIAIRLEEVVVHANRALWATDVRIDALVCTRASAGAVPYVVSTLPFPRIADDDRLPLDNAPLFIGEVADFVDVCLWISRDRGHRESLFDLLARRTTEPGFQQALAALAITSAPWVGAVGASLGLVRVAHDLLNAAVGTSIGLYRTSYLASEDFGLGRHPTVGLRRAQDVSFAMRIDPV